MTDAKERLKSLEQLLGAGLISGDEYAERRKRILDELTAPDNHEPTAPSPVPIVRPQPAVRHDNWKGPIKALVLVVLFSLVAAVAANMVGRFTSPGAFSHETRTQRILNQRAATSTTSTEATISRIVSYEVTGTAPSVAITMQNDSGGTDQMTVPVPWTWEYTNFSRGDLLYVSAQNQDDSGSILCSIKVQGTVVFTSTATGGYAICTASGSLP